MSVRPPKVGALPPLEVLADQPRWSWSVAWPDLAASENTADQVRAHYQHERTLTLDRLVTRRAGARSG